MKQILLALTVLTLMLLGGCGKADAYTPPEEPVVKLPSIRDEATANGYKDTDTDVIYYANVKTKRFHRPDCSAVKDTAETQLRLERDKEVLARDGYIPCKICDP